jgi:hypothetical protein
MSDIEIEHLRAILRRTAAERCRLGSLGNWPLDPAVSAEIEANAILDSQTRERLALLQQKGTAQ